MADITYNSTSCYVEQMPTINCELSCVDRMRKFKRRWDILHDNIKPYALYKMSSVYTQAAKLRLDKQLDTSNNVYKKVISHISGVYSNGVKREFTDAKLEELYKEKRVDKILKQSNFYLNAFNDLLLQVGWDESGLQLKFRYPHNTKVEYENGKIECIEYLVSNEDGEEKWAYWSDTEHYYKVKNKDGDSKIEPVDGNEEMINPYGKMPFIVMQNGFRDDDFFDVFSGDDLVDITLDTAIYLTFKNYQIKWNSFKTISLIGVNPEDVNGQTLDGSTPLALNNENASISVIDLQANIDQLLKVIQDSANAVAVNYGISPSAFTMSGQVQSGFAKMLDNIEVDLFIKEQQSDFLDYERQLAELISMVAAMNGITYNPELTVKFEEPYYPKTELEELQELEMEINLGLKSPLDEIMCVRGVTEDEALQIYTKNIEMRNKLNNKINQEPITTNLPIGA